MYYPGQKTSTRAQQEAISRRIKDQRELEAWQHNFRLLQQVDQKWTQILTELEQGFLDKESFEGYRVGIRRLLLNNDFRITDRRLL